MFYAYNVAEVNEAAIKKRHAQGWVDEVYDDVDKVIVRAKEARVNKSSVAIAYHGNIVSLWVSSFLNNQLNTKKERLAADPSFTPELASDQTSLHNPFQGGYYPVQVSFSEVCFLKQDI